MRVALLPATDIAGATARSFMACINTKAETPKSGGRRSEHGASLINLLIVACIMGILLSIVMPDIRAALEIERLNDCASKLASKLTDARIKALEHNRPAWLLIDSSARTLQIQTTDSSGSIMNVGAAESLLSGVSIGATPARVSFTSLGLVESTQTLILTGVSTGKTRTVSVSRVGKVSIDSMK